MAAKRPRNARYSTRAGPALIALAFGMFPGCAHEAGTRHGVAAQPAPDSRVAWEGDPAAAPWPVAHAAWRDVLAAVNSAASERGYAVAGEEAPSPLERVYRLIGVRGDSGAVRFRAERLVEGTLPGDPWVSFHIRLGAMANDEAEAAMREDLLRYRPKHAR